MKKTLRLLLAFGLIIGIAQMVSATTILYEASSLGGLQWEYTYSVTNDTLLGSDIEEFTVFFDMGLYDNLSVTTPLADWDEIAINPDASIPDDGFYDALALVSGIAPGATLSGFSVQFDWLGDGTPGNQFFDVVDSWTFDVLDSGETVLASAPVPEPATLLLLGSGLAGLVGLKRRARKHAA